MLQVTGENIMAYFHKMGRQAFHRDTCELDGKQSFCFRYIAFFAYS